MTELAAATTLGLLGDGRSLCKNEKAFARWVSQEFHAMQRSVSIMTDAHAWSIEAKLREMCGGRLPPGVPDRLADLLNTMIARARRQQHIHTIGLGGVPLGRTSILYASIARRVQSVLVPAFEHADYRSAFGRWAGGDNDYAVEVRDRTPGVDRRASKVWSRNGRWSGKDTHTYFSVRPSWPRVVGSSRVLLRYRGEKRVVLDIEDITGLGHCVLIVIPGRGYELRLAHVRVDEVTWLC